MASGDETDTRITLGDCVEVMAGMEAESVDAVVCDPPYGLSSPGKANLHCLSRLLAEIELPQFDQGNTETTEGGNLPGISRSGPFLCRVDGTLGILSRVSVPESPVDLKRTPITKEKINTSTESTGHGVSNGGLTDKSNIERNQDLGDFVLQLADSRNPAGCDGACSCFGEFSFGVLTMSVIPPAASSCRGALGRFGIARGNSVIGRGNYAGGETEGSSPVMTTPGTIDRAVLRLDMRRGTGELFPADGTLNFDPLAKLYPCGFVPTSTGTGDVSPVFDSLRVNIINDFANWTFTLHYPRSLKNLLDDNTTGGFMGKEWDGLGATPQSAYRWHARWATEALRVLKPGGHLLAFGGTRTVHRLTCALEDVGFSIRDQLCYMFGSGFPKSHDIGKAIDRELGAEREVIGKSTRHGGGIVGAGSSYELPPIVPDITAPATDAAKKWDGFGSNLKPGHEIIIVARKKLIGTLAQNVLEHGTGGINVDGCRLAPMAENDPNRRGLGYGFTKNDYDKKSVFCNSEQRTQYDTTKGRWPANVVLSHSPNCERVGVKRVKNTSGSVSGFEPSKPVNADAECYSERERVSFERHADPDGLETVEDWRCVPSCPVAMLDQQSGELKSGGGVKHRSAKDYEISLTGWKQKWNDGPEHEPNTGGASRFYKTVSVEPKEIEADARFFYCSKSSRAERSAGMPEGQVSNHPTQKPIKLMRWLVRLVTPPGGLVLDPFTGSGSTGIAARLEGFHFLGIEQDPHYIEIARARVGAWEQYQEDSKGVRRYAATTKDKPDERQLGLFGESGE